MQAVIAPMYQHNNIREHASGSCFVSIVSAYSLLMTIIIGTRGIKAVSL